MKKRGTNQNTTFQQLTTRWTKKAQTQDVWTEYPRPELVRSSYYNLNGIWKCAILTAQMPSDSEFKDPIHVPFSPESYLSGIGHILQPDEILWYRRTVEIPTELNGDKRLLVHFGAVDQHCTVYVGAQKVAAHTGGYLPFSVDVTDYLPRETSHEDFLPRENTTARTSTQNRKEQAKGTLFELTIAVRDFTDTSYHSRGKQKLDHSGMFYTPQSGIWQSVWMEVVPALSVKEAYFEPDCDASTVHLHVTLKNHVASDLLAASDDKTLSKSYAASKDCTLLVAIRPDDDADKAYRDHPEDVHMPDFDFENIIASCAVRDLQKPEITLDLSISLPDYHPWSPEDPFLYHATLQLQAGENSDPTLDRVDCYFAMRSCKVENDAKGVPRITLNGRPYLQAGVLDQGYWPDGLYTAPCDEALIYDIEAMKSLGFNMLRKHIKIEPSRWYYHCDRLGMLVWQDMVCGGTSYKHWFVTYLATALNAFHISFPDGKASRWLLSRTHEDGHAEFMREVKETVLTLRSHPSIVCWVPFNESWGQFDALSVCDYVKSLDSTRIIDHASGWFDQGGGDLLSLHYYFFKFRFTPEKHRAAVISEYGGYGYQIPEHSYSRTLYGYGKYDSEDALSAAYAKLHEEIIIPAVQKGISATIYTQVSDIEEETNGILTYDREIIKIRPDVIRKMNTKMQANLSFNEPS